MTFMTSILWGMTDCREVRPRHPDNLGGGWLLMFYLGMADASVLRDNRTPQVTKLSIKRARRHDTLSCVSYGGTARL